jgi:hypothetical protein
MIDSVMECSRRALAALVELPASFAGTWVRSNFAY